MKTRCVTKRLPLPMPAEQWYALGDWVLARGTFYSDRALMRESRECYAEGMRREQKLLPEDALDEQTGALPRNIRNTVFPKRTVWHSCRNRWPAVGCR